jgi:uncharacterized protein YlxW (UPF0749 family)
MKHAHIESKAVSSSRPGVHSIVRRFAAVVVIGVGAMTAAQAGPRDRDGGGQRDNNRGERMQQPEQRQRGDDRQRQYESRQYESRQYEQRADDQRRQQMQDQQNAQNNEAFRRSGRLTPDERRDLRRQINEAGADIYPNRPSRR